MPAICAIDAGRTGIAKILRVRAVPPTIFLGIPGQQTVARPLHYPEAMDISRRRRNMCRVELGGGILLRARESAADLSLRTAHSNCST
jgi:hypothetical protein